MNTIKFMGIRTKFILLVLIIMSFSGALILSIVGFKTNQIIYQMIHRNLHESSNLGINLLNTMYPGDWKKSEDKLYKGNKQIAPDLEALNVIKSSDTLSTIFLENVRISTNISSTSPIIGTKAKDEVTETVLKNGSDFLGEVEINGIDYETLYVPIKDSTGKTIGMFFIGKEKSFIQKNILAIVIPIITATLIILIIGLIFIYLITTKMVKGVQTLVEVMEKMEKGDFSHIIDNIKSKDEINSLSFAVNKVCENVSTIINKIKNDCSTLNDSSTSLASISEECAASNEQIAESVDIISKNSIAQANEAKEGLEDSEKFADNIQLVSCSINCLKDIITLLSDKIENEGHNIVQTLTLKNNDANKAIKNINDSIFEVDSNARNVNSILSTIQEISNKTKILSLNASIEAARAGESGKGFQVVAEEIGNLAASVSNATAEIEVLNLNIQTKSSLAVKKISETKIIFDEQSNAVKDTEFLFNNISDKNLLLQQEVQKISLSNNEMILNKDLIINVMILLKDNIQENSNILQQIAVSSEEQSIIVEEVANSAQVLTGICEDFGKVINNFNAK